MVAVTRIHQDFDGYAAGSIKLLNDMYGEWGMM